MAAGGGSTCSVWGIYKNGELRFANRLIKANWLQIKSVRVLCGEYAVII